MQQTSETTLTQAAESTTLSQTTVTLDEGLHQRAKLFAVVNKTSLRQLINDGLRLVLDRRESETAAPEEQKTSAA